MIVLLGDSHTRAIINGYAVLEESERDHIDSHGGFIAAMLGPAFSFSVPFWKPTRDGIVLVGNMQERFSSAMGADASIIRRNDDREFIFSIGAQPSLLYAPRAWEAHTAGAKHIKGLGYLSRAAFREALLYYNRYVLGFFRTLQDMNVRFSVMAGPPPSPQFSFIHQKGERGLELWLTHVEVFEEEMSRLGIAMEQPPLVVRAAEDDRFLRLALCDMGDERSPHGNSTYGQIFLKSILRQRGMTDLELDADSLSTELEQPSTLVDWHVKHGFRLANMRKPTSVDQFRTALDKDPTHRQAMMGLGYAFERLGANEEAMLHYESTLTFHPDYADCWAMLSSLQNSMRDYSAAKESLTRAIELGQSRPEWPFRMGAILEKLGELEQAGAILRPILFNDLYKKADGSLANAGDRKPSLIPEPDYYEAAMAQHFALAPYMVILGRVEFRLNDLDKAERCFCRAIEMDDTKPAWWAFVGDVHFARRDWAPAEQCYSTALKALPEVVKYAKRRAYCQERMGKMKEARETYLAALRSHPDDRSLLSLIAGATRSTAHSEQTRLPVNSS